MDHVGRMAMAPETGCQTPAVEFLHFVRISGVNEDVGSEYVLWRTSCRTNDRRMKGKNNEIDDYD